MKKFNELRKLNEIIKLAQEKGFDVDTTELNRGGDWVSLNDTDKRMVQISFKVCNGWFYVYKPDGLWATHRSSELDHDPLYSEILDLLYIAAA